MGSCALRPANTSYLAEVHTTSYKPCQLLSNSYVGRHEEAHMVTHLLRHADKRKSLMDKYMEDMPFLRV